MGPDICCGLAAVLEQSWSSPISSYGDIVVKHEAEF
jgi:hypothetical protein